jgi:hypothetical protein
VVPARGIEPSSLLQTRKLFIPHPGKSDKTDRNAEVRYTAGTWSLAGSEMLNCVGRDRHLRTFTGRTNTHTA